jgi:hypothetical protein
LYPLLIRSKIPLWLSWPFGDQQNQCSSLHSGFSNLKPQTMPFPQDDPNWMDVYNFLKSHSKPLAPILAPNDFLEPFPGTYPYNVSNLFSAQDFDFIVIHKAMLADIDPGVVAGAIAHFHALCANPVFVVYARSPIPDLDWPDESHIQALEDAWNQMDEPTHQPPTYAAVITTYNRPEALRRSLPQILGLGIPVVVVDDGSSPDASQSNQQIIEQHKTPLIRIPNNRGLPNAINVGIEYWLADPDITWISYFQDDIDVNPDLIHILSKIQHPTQRPLIAGRDAAEHPTLETTEIAGYTVLLKRSIPGQHLHAHRDYWRAVLPIPTPYLGAPKTDRGKPGQGADEDWWITAWSPQSVTKQGGYVVCVPDLVTTFYPDADASTWGNISVR